MKKWEKSCRFDYFLWKNWKNYKFGYFSKEFLVFGESIFQSDDLRHFSWKERTATDNDLDLIIFPEESTFHKIDKCTTGKVYLLELKQTSQRFFFWLQEPESSKISEGLEAKINNFFNPDSPPNLPNPSEVNVLISSSGNEDKEKDDKQPEKQ